MAYRWYHPSVLTEVALLATITGVVQASLGLLAERLDPASGVFGGNLRHVRRPRGRHLAPSRGWAARC